MESNYERERRTCGIECDICGQFSAKEVKGGLITEGPMKGKRGLFFVCDGCKKIIVSNRRCDL